MQKIKKYLKKISQSNFVKDTAILQMGTFFSTGLTFLASIAYARFLGPENYGKYVLIFAFVSLIQIFMHLGADYAVLTLLSEAWTKKDKQEIKNLIIFFFKVTLIVSLTIGILAIIFSPIIADSIYNNSYIGILARWILLACMLKVMFSLLIIILQVARKIKHLTIIENINKIIYILVPVAFVVLFKFGLPGIVWGHLVSSIIFLIFSIYFYNLLLKKTDLLPNFKEIFLGLKSVSIKKYFKFGFTIAVDKNLASLYSVLPLFFLGMFVNDAEVSYFKIAFSYLGLALIFLKPISRLLMVQFPKSKTYGKKELKKHFYKSTLYSVLMVCVIILPMLLLSRYLVDFFYGIKYLPSVKIIYILWPYVIFSAFGVGLSSMFRALNKMRIAITANLIVLILTTPLIYLAIKTYGLIGMAISVIFWTIVPIFILLIYFYNYFKKSNLIHEENNTN